MHQAPPRATALLSRAIIHATMKQPIIGYHLDEQAHWVAELACGHNQHVRHNPPWVERKWVTTAEGRDAMQGYALDCKKCDRSEPPDHPV